MNRTLKLSPEHLGLPARHPAALKDWYVRALDARVVLEIPGSPPAFFVQLPGGLILEIYQSASVREETGDNSLAGWRHLALRVDSIAEARAVLTERGVNFDQPVKPAGGGGQVLFFKDAEGNLLHLVERPADSIFCAR
ncbi:MAG: VOC family protein [Verrucomicrobia bacterium]|nr:VOC family protein [Verrucomicrobiota bacterium]